MSKSSISLGTIALVLLALVIAMATAATGGEPRRPAIETATSYFIPQYHVTIKSRQGSKYYNTKRTLVAMQ